MRNATVWQHLLGLVNVVVEDIDFDLDAAEVVVSIRPRKKAAKPRCGVCGQVCARYDHGEGRRRWRTLDVGLWRCFLEADAPRVRCPEHGVVVRGFGWARHGARHTHAFEDQVAWLTVRTSKTAVTNLMRVSWRTVAAIVVRVVGDARARHDPLEGLTRIGIDELSYKRNNRYVLVVVDHDTGRLVWIDQGRDRAAVRRFFDELGPERSAAIRLVSADAAAFIADVVAERCRNASLCLDPFHIIAWATEAVDEVRRRAWNQHRRTRGGRAIARQIKGSRFVLWRGGEHLDEKGRTRLAWIAEVNAELYHAYLLKEQLRAVFALRGADALAALDQWIEEAAFSGIDPIVDLADQINRHRAGIEATLTHGLSNGLIESINTKIRLLTRIAFGFKNPDSLIALALLDRGGYTPQLPTRAAA